jgi:hypothetical protein
MRSAKRCASWSVSVVPLSRVSMGGVSKRGPVQIGVCAG